MLDDAAGNFAVPGGDSTGSVQRNGSPDEQGNALQPQQNALQQVRDAAKLEKHSLLTSLFSRERRTLPELWARHMSGSFRSIHGSLRLFVYKYEIKSI